MHKPDIWTATGMVEVQQPHDKLDLMVEGSNSIIRRKSTNKNLTLKWTIISVGKRFLIGLDKMALVI